MLIIQYIPQISRTRLGMYTYNTVHTTYQPIQAGNVKLHYNTHHIPAEPGWVCILIIQCMPKTSRTRTGLYTYNTVHITYQPNQEGLYT